MKPTKEEISLCKQVAEKGLRFEPPDNWHGAYYVFHQDHIFSWADGEDKPDPAMGKFVWLPEISDCLKFLREKGFQTFLIMELARGWGCDGYIGDKIYGGEGDTILEACLKAVLAVLEETK